MTYIGETLGKIVIKERYIWMITAKRYETAPAASMCIEMSSTHSRTRHVLVVDPGINNTLTHARLTIDYLDNGRVMRSLCCGQDHKQGRCPYRPLCVYVVC